MSDVGELAAALRRSLSRKKKPMPDQRCVTEQLRDLVQMANERGLYDATDWIARRMEKRA